MIEEIPDSTKPVNSPEIIRPEMRQIFDRRRFLGGAAMAGLLAGPIAAAAGGSATVALPSRAEPATHASGSLAVNVHDFGALGNGRKDNTAAFQKALDHVHTRGGGIVAVPAGRYLFKGHLVLPQDTTLQGVFRAPPAFVHNSGTVLWPTEGRGKPDGHPFLTSQGHNVTIRGLGIYYPGQDVNAAVPAPYPWTIQHGAGDNLAVLDVALTNPYQGMHLVLAGRHYIARVYGQPLLTGIYVDQCYDIGRIENIHFWPFWANGNSLLWKWVCQHGTGIRIARSDWEYVFNTFVLGYNIGYHFAQSPHGACNGNFIGLGSDASGRAAVVVENSQPPGLLITNGEFVGDQRPDSEGVIVEAGNTGRVCFQNCSFWGPSNRIGTLRGKGPVNFMGCAFLGWDKNKRGEPAFLLDGAPATISQCQFYSWGPPRQKTAVRITARCSAAVITGNTRIGKKFVVQNPPGLSPRRFQIAMNVATEE